MRSLLTDNAPAAPTQWNTFHIFSLPRDSSPFDRTIFLEGADLQGRQYACYEFMESTLGIRFLNPDFDFYPIVKGNAMTLTEVPIHSPDFHWRGLQVWHYNYDRRGTDTFCNINKHVVDGNWEWFRRLARWMIANKQNLIQWYDETMCYDPISVHLPKEIIQYIRMRGIHRLLGIGWPANEGMPADWRTDKEHICIKPDGECVDADPQSWMRCPCQATSDYWKLAEKNMAAFNFNDPDIIGAVINYGETTRMQKEDIGCARHTKSGWEYIQDDYQFFTNHLKTVGREDLPVGFVVMNHGGSDTPLFNPKLLDSLNKNGIHLAWTYGVFGWENHKPLFKWVDEQNKNGGNHKIIELAEVCFICATDIPIFKPSMLRRRERHFNDLDRTHILGHLTNCNTTQYLVWLKQLQMMRWQWHFDKNRTWQDEFRDLINHLCGKDAGGKLAEVVDRICCLEYLIPYDPAAIREPAPQTEHLPKWVPWVLGKEYAQIGYPLWAFCKDFALLQNARESLTAAHRLLDQIAQKPNQVASQYFTDILRLTLSYFEVRIEMGLAAWHIEEAKKSDTWNSDVTENITTALEAYQAAIKALTAYDTVANAIHGKDLRNVHDFITNPKPELIRDKFEHIRDLLDRKDFETLKNNDPCGF